MFSRETVLAMLLSNFLGHIHSIPLISIVKAISLCQKDITVIIFVLLIHISTEFSTIWLNNSMFIFNFDRSCLKICPLLVDLKNL
jgi:hypothetical protein